MLPSTEVEIDDPRYVIGGFTRMPLAYKVAELVRKASRKPELAPTTWDVRFDDISYWQGLVNFFLMRLFAQLVYIRAGYGDNGIDTQLEANVAGSENAGMEHGLYWFIKPRALDNWKYHLASFKEVWLQFRGKLPPVFDCEYTELDKVATSEWLTKLVMNWEQMTGVSPVIYTSAYWWNTHTIHMDWPKMLLIWAAHWSSMITAPMLPSDWLTVVPSDWWGWQWKVSEDGNKHGCDSQKVDLNRMNMTIAEVNKRYGTNILPLGDAPPLPPPGELPLPIQYLYRVKVTTTVNMRAQPVATSERIGRAATNDELAVIEEYNGWKHVEGWVSGTYTRKV